MEGIGPAPGSSAGMGDFETRNPSDPALPGDESTADRPQQVTFPLAVRGYDRLAVDEFVQSLQARIAELETGQTPEGAVQKALDQVGVETAGILQRAHAAADELAARSGAEGNQRVQRAQSEADQIRREADDYSEQIVADTRVLWEERMRLIEDLRQLADQVLSTADDAFERLQMPEPLGDRSADSEPTTAEALAIAPGAEPVDEFDEPQSLDDTTAWSVGEVEAEPAEGETTAYETGAFGDESLDAETAPYRIGAVDDEPATEDGTPAVEEETDHTVELEALPGGGANEPVEDDVLQPEPERGWDRERD